MSKVGEVWVESLAMKDNIVGMRSKQEALFYLAILLLAIDITSAVLLVAA